jgi:uncharacterized membrane protein YbaN (DUF454 family)
MKNRDNNGSLSDNGKRIGLYRTVVLIIGTVFLIIGILGVFIPVLPTTPFLLLAAYLYARSSKELYHWITTNRWFGEYVKNYRDGKGIPITQKVLTIILLWITIGYTIWFIVVQWWIQIILLIIAMSVTAHIIFIKTYRA